MPYISGTVTGELVNTLQELAKSMKKDVLNNIIHEVTQGRVFALLPEETQAKIRALPPEVVRQAALFSLTRPQPGDASPYNRLLLNPCLTMQWLDIFEELNLPRDMAVFEPCSGSSEPVILATEIYTNGKGRYSTINLNRPLAAELLPKLAKLRLHITLIGEDATRREPYQTIGPVDVACYHHAINDILQTAVSEPRGMDTCTIDWWANERQMIEWLAEDAAAGRLGERARPALLDAVRHSVELVKPGGYLLFDHWTWEAHRAQDWFPWQLFCDLIPMAREWIMAEGLPLTECPLAGKDSRWWMCLRREG
jgi:hypothetical protein